MTLLHAFVRDELALRRQLEIPALRSSCLFNVLGESITEHLAVPAETFVFTESKTEARGEGVQPDVLFQTASDGPLAVEVKYSHAVDPEKLKLLHRNYLKVAEFDVSDLPPSGITKSQFEAALTESHRWTWLVNPRLRMAEATARLRLEWVRTDWRPEAWPSPPPEVKPARQKLKQAQGRMRWASTAVASLRSQGLPSQDAAKWLGEQNKIDRVAIACTTLRLEPEQLPRFLQQAIPKPLRAFAHHPYSWQAPIFMKFCIGTKAFSSQEAGRWCLVALPDRCEQEDGTESSNGFTRTSAALHQYFLRLVSLHLLRASAHAAEDERRFTPRLSTVTEFHRYLADMDEKTPAL